jgi:hypothetical protein
MTCIRRPSGRERCWISATRPSRPVPRGHQGERTTAVVRWESAGGGLDGSFPAHFDHVSARGSGEWNRCVPIRPPSILWYWGTTGQRRGVGWRPGEDGDTRPSMMSKGSLWGRQGRRRLSYGHSLALDRWEGVGGAFFGSSRRTTVCFDLAVAAIVNT